MRKLLAQLRLHSPFADFVDFAGNGQLVTGTSGDRRFEIWDLKSQKSEIDISPRDRVAKESVVLSPGRHNLAMIGAGTLWVYDLRSGRKIGRGPVPKNGIFDLACKDWLSLPTGLSLPAYSTRSAPTSCVGMWPPAALRTSSSMTTRAESSRLLALRDAPELASGRSGMAALWLRVIDHRFRSKGLHDSQRNAGRRKGASEDRGQESGADYPWARPRIASSKAIPCPPKPSPARPG